MAKCLINHRKSGWWYINPSEKSWSSSQLGWWNSQYMVESHKIHVPNHQPAMASPKSSILIGFSIANYPETIDNHMPICSMYSIFTYMWLNYRVNVGKYSSTMEHMGYIVIGLLFTNFQRFRGHAGPTGAPQGPHWTRTYLLGSLARQVLQGLQPFQLLLAQRCGHPWPPQRFFEKTRAKWRNGLTLGNWCYKIKRNMKHNNIYIYIFIIVLHI